MPESDEVLEADEIIVEESEDEATIIITGKPTTAIVYPYQCSVCETEFTCGLGQNADGDYTVDYCPSCGVEFTAYNDEAVK